MRIPTPFPALPCLGADKVYSDFCYRLDLRHYHLRFRSDYEHSVIFDEASASSIRGNWFHEQEAETKDGPCKLCETLPPTFLAHTEALRAISFHPALDGEWALLDFAMRATRTPLVEMGILIPPQIDDGFVLVGWLLLGLAVEAAAAALAEVRRGVCGLGSGGRRLEEEPEDFTGPEGVTRHFGCSLAVTNCPVPDWAGDSEQVESRSDELLLVALGLEMMGILILRLPRVGGSTLLQGLQGVGPQVQGSQETMRHLLFYIDGVFKELGIRYIVTDGVLLGSYKFRGMLDWDADVEVVQHRVRQDGHFLRKHANEANYLLIELNLREEFWDPDRIWQVPVEGIQHYNENAASVAGRLFPAMEDSHLYGMSFFRHRLRHVPEWEEVEVEVGLRPLRCSQLQSVMWHWVALRPYHYNCVDETQVFSGKDCRRINAQSCGSRRNAVLRAIRGILPLPPLWYESTPGCAAVRGASVPPADEVSLLDSDRDVSQPFARLQVRLDQGLRVVFCVELQHTLRDLEDAVDQWCTDQSLSGLRGCHLRTAFPPRTYADPDQTISDAGLAPSATLFVASEQGGSKVAKKHLVVDLLQAGSDGEDALFLLPHWRPCWSVADTFVAPGVPRALRRPVPGRTALNGWSLFPWGTEDEDKIWKQYAAEDGLGIREFGRLAHDGLLLEGKLEEYEQAFSGVDEGNGVISRASLGQLFAGLGKKLSAQELDQIVDEADVGHDGIDFADFLGLARTHLDLAEVVRYLETTPKRVPATDEAVAGMLGHITEVHSEAELDAIVASGNDVVVKLAFTWCKPCKAFAPRYEKYAKVYKETTFLKIVGNENESCKHYAKEVLRARISPMFAVYSGGKLLTSWNGANNQRFMDKMEEFLPSARQFIKELQGLRRV
ncbi:unnamed protein product [Symbiodinium natans]|uniref:Thioredoxin domain-containing protein n=1 Tax=Symbiodinium natans TaxID=878477 RepID=A0A812QX00_9DINO|nr:unnamed protein product [Symbiodinium natans]